MVDAGFKGLVKAVLYNHGSEVYMGDAGDRVCQMVVVHHCPLDVSRLALVVLRS